MITTMYLILFLVSVIYLFVLLNRFGTKVSTYYVLLSICIILVNYGYWQTGISGTLEEALAASRFSYLGSSFVAFFMMCCIAQLTKTNMPMAVKILGAGMSTTVAGLSMTIGYSDIYYKDAQFYRIDGFSYLVKEYAPAHWLYTVLIILSMGYCLYMIIVALTKQKKISYVSSVYSLIIMLSVALIYFIDSGVYSLLPLAYDVGFAFILLLLNRIYLNNIDNISVEGIKDSREYGFVTFDSRRCFIDGDAAARMWFPELNDLKIDHAVSDCNTEFLKQVNAWVTERDENNTRLFNCAGRIIEAKCIVLDLRITKKVFCIRLHDDTKNQEYTRLVENYNRDLEKNIALKTQ